MRKRIPLFLILLVVQFANAQNVGINNSGVAPDVSAMLDIVATDKGLLIPRLALSSKLDNTTVTSPTTSLLVYNTTTAGVAPNSVTPGYYYWNGAKWTRLVNEDEITEDWSITGNSGTNSSTNFIGTTDAQDLNFRVNNDHILSLDADHNILLGSEADRSPFNVSNTYTDNIIGGSNWTLSGVTNLYNSTLFGTGVVTGQNLRNLFMVGESNTKTGHPSLLAGFTDQAIQIFGKGNSYDMSGFLTTPNLGGIFGLDNTLTNTTFYYVFGSNNTHINGGVGLTVGASNNISNPSTGSLVIGSSNSGTGSAVVLGVGNTVGSAAGNQNVIIASNVDVGSRSNVCVIADRTATIPSTAFTTNNRFYGLYSQGYILWTNTARTAGVTVPGGGGSWSSVSDRNLKTNITALDYQDILEKISSFKICRWSYKSQLRSANPNYASDIYHVGVMAQDFYKAFSLDVDDKHINSLDVGGVNMAAIIALKERNEELKEELDFLVSRINELEKQMK